MASETGVLDIPPENVLFKERIYPGRMFLLDGDEGRLVGDEEIKAGLSARKPYGRWLEQNTVDLDRLPEPSRVPGPDFYSLPQRQAAEA